MPGVGGQIAGSGRRGWGSPKREWGTDGPIVRVGGEAGGSHEMKHSLKWAVWAAALSALELQGYFPQRIFSPVATSLTTWAGASGKAYRENRLKFGA